MLDTAIGMTMFCSVCDTPFWSTDGYSICSSFCEMVAEESFCEVCEDLLDDSEESSICYACMEAEEEKQR